MFDMIRMIDVRMGSNIQDIDPFVQYQLNKDADAMGRREIHVSIFDI